MGKRIARLEQALAVWEDTCYLQKKLYKFMPESAKIKLNMPDYTGPLVHYREFRDHVIHDSAKGNYDLERFTFSKTADESSVCFSAVPTNLFAWNHYSRRVFRLDKSLQTMLSATSLEGLYWNEIKWPFQSFVIELSDPLADDDGKLYDYIIVSEVGKICDITTAKDGEIFSILLLSQELEEYRPLNKKKIERIFKRETETDMLKMVRKWEHLYGNYSMTFAIVAPANSDKDLQVNKSFKESVKIFKEKYGGLSTNMRKFAASTEIEMPEEEDDYAYYSLFDKAKHLVASICLFLSTLPPKETLDTDVSRKTRKEASEMGLPCVSSAEEIFQLQCESVLSRETQETVAEIIRSRNSRDVRPHWRRGHWRRIWGSKENLHAPRIWIRPCLVNKEKLPQNSVPLASQTNLK